MINSLVDQGTRSRDRESNYHPDLPDQTSGAVSRAEVQDQLRRRIPVDPFGPEEPPTRDASRIVNRFFGRVNPVPDEPPRVTGGEGTPRPRPAPPVGVRATFFSTNVTAAPPSRTAQPTYRTIGRR
jgi:hypothetical protein